MIKEIPNVGELMHFAPDERLLLRDLLKMDHLEFSIFFFRVMYAANMVVGPHHNLISKALDDVIKGEIKNLIISVPPRYTKTIMAVIMFIARGLAINPKARFVHLSYAQDLALNNSEEARSLIQSEEFQALWPLSFKADSDAKNLWKTAQGGTLRAGAAGGIVTGFGAGLMEPGFNGALIIDDALKPSDAEKKERGTINERFTNTLRSRRATEDTPMIVIMQRVHNHDLVGHLLRGGSGDHWHHLNLPVIVEPDKPYPAEYTHGIPIPTNLPAGPLWPAKHNAAQIKVLKRDGKTYAAQYMQDPRLSSDPVFLPRYFNRYEIRPPSMTVYIPVDPSAGRSAKSDRTAMPVIGISETGNKYLLDGFCHRMKLSERWANLRMLHRKWKRAPGVNLVLVGYEQYGMQSDLEYILERQEIEGEHFPIEELNWPREGEHAKPARIQRLEPDFKDANFYLPAIIWRPEDGGECFWKGEDRGFSYWEVQGETTLQRMMKEKGEGWRIGRPIVRRDENKIAYDVTQRLIDELKDFPHSEHDDISDAVSRIYDMGVTTHTNAEKEQAAALNEAAE